jgi:hypothetical protein
MTPTKVPAPNTDVRLSLLETEVAGIQTTLQGVGNTLEKIRTELVDRPRATSYRETIGAAAATAAVMVALAGLANWWLYQSTAVIRDNVARLETTISAGDYAVMKYRLEQLERLAR